MYIFLVNEKGMNFSMEISNSSSENKFLKNVLKGTVISLITTLVLFLIFALLLTYTNISENTIFPVIVVITGVSILLGSFLGNIKIKKNGLLNGGLIGLIYMLLLYFISSCFVGDFSLNVNSFILIIAGILGGMLGGIIGVNIGR